MGDGGEVRLTAGEVAQLWSQYMADGGSICVLSYFLEKAEDDEVRPLIENCVRLAEAHVAKLREFFVREGFQVRLVLA